jgi:hypothetical protein
MKSIPLTKGTTAWVDDQDYDYLMQWKWRVSSEGYARRDVIHNGRRHSIYMHRIVVKRVGKNTKPEVDHRNHNRLDNRRGNLRPATKQENMANRGPQRNNTSGYKGVYWDKSRSLWLAAIKVDRRMRFLGRWPTKKAAAQAYNKATRAHFGEYSHLNEV